MQLNIENLKFDFGALMEVEEHFDCNVLEGDLGVLGGKGEKRPRLSDYATFAACGLNHTGASMDERMTASRRMSINDIKPMLEAVTRDLAAAADSIDPSVENDTVEAVVFHSRDAAQADQE